MKFGHFWFKNCLLHTSSINFFKLDSSLKLCLYHLQLPINLTTISFYTLLLHTTTTYLLLFRRALLIVLVAHMILSPTRRSAMKLQIGVTLFSHVTNIWRQEELHKTMNGGVTNHHTKNFLDTSSRVWFKKKWNLQIKFFQLPLYDY